MHEVVGYSIGTRGSLPLQRAAGAAVNRALIYLSVVTGEAAADKTTILHSGSHNGAANTYCRFQLRGDLFFGDISLTNKYIGTKLGHNGFQFVT